MSIAASIKAMIALKAARIITLTQAEYDALPTINPAVFYAIIES